MVRLSVSLFAVYCAFTRRAHKPQRTLTGSLAPDGQGAGLWSPSPRARGEGHYVG